MARPYSLDLREHVVAAFATGGSCRKVAAPYKVSVASVVVAAVHLHARCHRETDLIGAVIPKRREDQRSRHKAHGPQPQDFSSLSVYWYFN
jgi:hypothetical protein